MQVQIQRQKPFLLSQKPCRAKALRGHVGHGPTWSLGKKSQRQKPEHSPTLNTVIMVEKTLQKIDGSIITVAALKRKLPRQVNHNTLITILSYLEESNKIAVSLKGITWIQNRNANLRKAIAGGLQL